MSRRFDDATLSLLDAAPTVRIETVDRHAPGGPLRSTIIWIVVDGADVFARSVRGPRGRWFRDLLGDPRATLRPHKGGWSPIEVTAEAADDATSIERCSRALQRSSRGIRPSA
jgi:hypothetical protein